jgi:uncharacterized protein
MRVAVIGTGIAGNAARLDPVEALSGHGRRESLTTAALLRSLFALPLVTLKIVAEIHWEALRLWLKGARLVPRPHAAGANIAFDTHYQLGDRQTRRL